VTNGADPLAEFYVATHRQASGLSGRPGVHGQVDEILNELRIPAEVDKDGDWKLTTDVGPFLLIVDKEKSDLIVVQTIQSMEKKVKNSSDEMYVLLALNFEARGLARFGTVKDGGQDLLVLTARLAPDTISRETVQGMMGDCLRLSRRVDELLGNDPPAVEAQPDGWQAADAALAQAEGGPPPAEPPPPPPEQAPVDAPGAETVFAQPVPEAPQEPDPAPPAEPEPSYPPPVVAEPDPPPAEPEPSYPPPVVAAPEPAPAPVQPEPSYPPPTVPEPEPVQSYQPPQPPVALPEANWYPDPYYQARLRYWDGQSWTQHVAN
jgi:hypothetical protein